MTHAVNENSHKTAIGPRLALASFIFAIGWASPLFKLAGAPELLASGARVAIATIILLPFCWRDAHAGIRNPSAVWRAMLAGALLAAHFSVWVPSLQLTTVAASTLLVATEPLFAAAAESWLLRERLPRRLIAGIVISLGGTALVLSADFLGDPDAAAHAFGGRALLGDALALTGALFGALYFVTGRSVRARIPVGGYLILVNGTAATLLLIGSLVRGEPWFATNAQFPDWHGINAGALGWFFLLATIPQLLGHGAANIAVRHYPATVVNLAVLSEPILASTLAYLLFRESPRNIILFVSGGVVLLAGLVIALTAKRVEKAPQ